MKLQTKSMNIITKSRTLYSSSPNDVVKAQIFVQNSYDAQTVDVLWAYGTFNEGTEIFTMRAFWLNEQYTFPGLSNHWWESGAFYTPNDPGTWDLLGILADDIYLDGSDRLIVVGQHGSAFIEDDAWTISATTELTIMGVGVQGA